MSQSNALVLDCFLERSARLALHNEEIRVWAMQFQRISNSWSGYSFSGSASWKVRCP